MANKIVVIDDESTSRRLVAYHLNRAGFEVFPCSSGPVGIVRAKEVYPDLIIVDRIMPIIDGYTVCEKIRSDPELKDTPILMLTASEASVGDIQKAYHLKLSGYIKKTSDMGDLMTRVNELLQKEEQRFKEKFGPLNFYQKERGTVILIPFYNSQTIDRIEETLDHLSNENISNVVIDLSRIKNIDDVLVGRLSELRYDKLAQFNDIKIHISNVTKSIKEITQTYSLPYYQKLDEALEDFQEPLSDDYLADLDSL